MINLILVLSKECGENLTKYLSGDSNRAAQQWDTKKQTYKRNLVIVDHYYSGSHISFPCWSKKPDIFCIERTQGETSH